MDSVLDGLRQALPVKFSGYSLVGKKTGFIIVDAINAFCTPGCGPLAPPASDPAMQSMVKEINLLARWFQKNNLPMFVECDTHDEDKPEPPYPKHAIRGTGHEKLVPELEWLYRCALATFLEKDCINGFVGAMVETEHQYNPHFTNLLINWVNAHRLETLLFGGDCTEICVSDVVVTMLSARNHGLMPTLKDIVVYEPACTTYHLPKEVVLQYGLPPEATHPRDIAHHVGLWIMASRGAIIANELQLS